MRRLPHLSAEKLLPRLVDAEARLATAIRRCPEARTRAHEELQAALVTALAHLGSEFPEPRDPERPLNIQPGPFFEEQFGFLPNVFRAQMLRPDVVEAEAFAVDTILLTGDVLGRRQKEYIVLAVSAANRNVYFVAVYGEILKTQGVAEETIERIVENHRGSTLMPADQVLIDFALLIARGDPAASDHVAVLRGSGLSDPQILEAAAVASFTNFLNALQVGLGAQPDFRPRYDFASATQLPAEPSRDPDTELVALARRGNTQAFEELVRRHHRRVHRAALCVTGNHEDAEDAAQVAFVKAFQSLATFERNALFTTWLTRIAINEALSRVRARKPMENVSLDDEERNELRPSLNGTWVDDPEQLYAREELRRLIERAMSGIPVRYRMAVLLRDVEQLSTAEAASALGVPVPTLKKHLMRGRLMLREALSPYFLSGQGATARV